MRSIAWANFWTDTYRNNKKKTLLANVTAFSFCIFVPLFAYAMLYLKRRKTGADMKNASNDLYHIPAVYRGKSYVTRECIVGKLSFWQKDRQSSRPHASIVVLTSDSESSYLKDGEDISTVAVVFIGDRPSDALCAHAGARALPLLILGKLGLAHDGRIAILDSRNATLFVDPDREILDRYARHLRLAADRRLLSLLPALCPCHTSIPFAKEISPLFDRARMIMAHDHERLCGPPTEEEELFECLRELAEAAVDVPLIFCIRVYDLHAERALTALQARFRALLRAAVYGSFSLALEGLCCAEQVKNAFSLWEQTICELSTEGREHDKNMPRGMIVESPLLLHGLRDCPPFDYLCIHGDRLWQSVLTPYASKCISVEAAIAFGNMLADTAHTLSVPICLRTDLPPEENVWHPSTHPVAPHPLFVPEKYLSAWCESI